MGLMGLAHSVVPTAVIFVAFAVIMGSERVGAVHGSASGHHIPLPLVSPQGARDLLRVLSPQATNPGEFFSFLS